MDLDPEKDKIIDIPFMKDDIKNIEGKEPEDIYLEECSRYV